MCGLFGGVSNFLNDTEIENIRTLGAISFPRGEDSVGLSWCHQGNNRMFNPNSLKYGLDKVVSDPYGYLFHPKTVSFLKGLNSVKAIIGHNRQATVGEITKDNAHPFRVGDIVGAHNGTIHSIKPTDGTTDSQELFTRISKNGLKSTLSELKTGAYALAFFDMKDHTLNLIRNDERPLWIMHTSSKPGTVYFASEKRFLDYLSAGSNIVYDTPYLITSGSLYTFDLKSMGVPKVTENYSSPSAPSETFQRMLPSPEFTGPAWENEPTDEEAKQETTKETKEETKEQSLGFLLPPFVSNPFGNKTQGVWEVIDKEVLKRCTATSIDFYDQVIPKSIVTIPRGILIHKVYKSLRYAGFEGKLIEPDDLLEILRQGCLISKKVPKVTDKLFWVNNKEFITADNINDDLVMEYVTNKMPEQGALVYVRGSTAKLGRINTNVAVN